MGAVTLQCGVKPLVQARGKMRYFWRKLRQFPKGLVTFEQQWLLELFENTTIKVQW